MFRCYTHEVTSFCVAIAASFNCVTTPRSAQAATSNEVELPGPAPRAGLPADTARANRLCVPCHRTIAEEWQRSLHRHAYDNQYFARAVKLEPVSFCRKCHAADANPDAEPPMSVAADGVSCLTCHATVRGILGAHGTSAERVAEHNTDGDPRWSTDQACVRCHEFDFPAKAGATQLTAMQATISEHAASEYPNVPCQGCHMPLVVDADGSKHHRHDFTVQADPGMLARAVKIRLLERTASNVTIELTTGRVGHAFPTGDLYRSVELSLWVGARARAQTRSAVVYRLERGYYSDAANHTRRVYTDTRLVPHDGKPDKRRIQLDLASRGLPIQYRLSWWRIPKELATRLGLDPMKQEQVVLEGSL